MSKQRVLLICSQHLFGESMETILRVAEDMELVGPWELDGDVCQRIAEARPGVVVIANEDPQSEAVTHLIAAILEQYPDLSVIRSGLSENVFRVFSTHTLPARGADLLETIRNLPTRDFNESPSQPKIKSVK
jgi:chemotaxis response regulator CheB